MAQVLGLSSEFPRVGAWGVDEEGRVGILTAVDMTVPIDPEHPELGKKKIRVPEFHVTDERGDTALVVPRSYEGLRQAGFDEIPEPRRAHLSADDGERMGY